MYFSRTCRLRMIGRWKVERKVGPTKTRISFIVYIDVSSLRDRRRRLNPAERRDENVLDRYLSRANRNGKACNLHLTATFRLTCLLLLLLLRLKGRRETREREGPRFGEKEASVLWIFFWLKGSVGVVQREKKTRGGMVSEETGRSTKPAASS